MLKYALLAGAMIVAAPAIAQEQQPQTAPNEMTKAPVTSTAPTSDTTALPPSSAAPQAAAPTTDQATAATTTATGTDKIAQVVDSEFPTYDKDANGSLNTAEFGTWMAALRTASDASVKPASKEMKAWTATAFAQADIDKSKSISKTELTGFLAKGQS